MGCLSSGDLKEEKTLFALCNRLYRIPVLSSRKRPRSCYDVGWFVTWLGFRPSAGAPKRLCRFRFNDGPRDFGVLGPSLEALLWFAFQRLANREKKDGTLDFRVRRKEVNHVIVEEG